MVENSSKVLLKKFLETGKKQTYVRGEIIIYTYSPPVRAYYWIAEGYVKVTSTTRGGSERIHYLYGPNELFPIGWLFKRPYQQVTFTAISGVIVYETIADVFNAHISKFPFLMDEVIDMQLYMHDRIYNLNLDDAAERLAHSLLILVQRFGRIDGQYTVLDIPLTQQEFADTVRLSRETTGKLLNDFEKKGYIVYGRKRILVNIKNLSTVMEHS